jgi:hypothetical protein
MFEEIKVSFSIRPKHLLLSPLGILLAFGVYKLPWSDSNAPAWVQAVGSIAAIFAAIWIANIQERQREAQEKARARQDAEKIASLASFIGARVLNACQFLTTPFRENREIILRFVDEVDECLSLAQRVDLAHIPGADLTREWFFFVNWISTVSDQYHWRSGKREQGSLDNLMPPESFIQQGTIFLQAVVRAASKQ